MTNFYSSIVGSAMNSASKAPNSIAHTNECFLFDQNPLSTNNFALPNNMNQTIEKDLTNSGQNLENSNQNDAVFVERNTPNSQNSQSPVLSNCVHSKTAQEMILNIHGNQPSHEDLVKKTNVNTSVGMENPTEDDTCRVSIINDFKDRTIRLLDVIVEEQGDTSDENSCSLKSVVSSPVNDERTTHENNDQSSLCSEESDLNAGGSNSGERPKCQHVAEAESLSDTSSNSMLKKNETDSDTEIIDLKSGPYVPEAQETGDITYQEDTTSTDLLHQTESLDNTYCETAFGKGEVDCELKRWNSKHCHSRNSRERKESFEQKLRRRFTIHDEHKQEVAKRIIALVIKYSLFVFNFCSWVVATVAIGVGLWVLTDKGKIVTDGSDFFLDPTIMICIVGGITFVVAFLGCVGALRENLLLLKIFFIVLGIIVVIEVIIAITVFIMYTVPEVREKFLRSTPENILRSAIVRYMDDNDIKTWIDLIQQEFRCCGIGGVGENDEGFRDWQLNAYFNCTPSNKSIYRCAVPTSCCIFEKGDRVNIMCGFDMSDKKVIDVRDYIFTRGCIHGFGEWLSKYDELIVIAALTTLIMQFLAVISAKIMIRRIEKRRRRWGRLLRSSTSTSS